MDNNSLWSFCQSTQFFSEIAQSKLADDTLWLICGDFNATISAEDGTNPQPHRDTTMQFKALVNNLGLIDMSLHGRDFTWCNNRQDPVFARLDRVLYLHWLELQISEHNSDCLTKLLFWSLPPTLHLHDKLQHLSFLLLWQYVSQSSWTKDISSEHMTLTSNWRN